MQHARQLAEFLVDPLHSTEIIEHRRQDAYAIRNTQWESIQGTAADAVTGTLRSTNYIHSAEDRGNGQL